MKDVEKAAEMLKKGNHTCVLVKDDVIFTSDLRGIAPVLQELNSGRDLRGFSAADRIVGKAAAELFAEAGIKEVHALTISAGGADYLQKQNIPFSYETMTDKIVNRKGDDICPMEKTVLDIDDHHAGYLALKAKVESMRKTAQ